MDPLEPWIDASAVRRLAENLLSAPRETTVETGPDTGFGSDFVGFAADRVRPFEVSARAAASEDAPPFERVPVPAAPPVLPPPIPQAQVVVAPPSVLAPTPVREVPEVAPVVSTPPISEAPPRVFTPVEPAPVVVPEPVTVPAPVPASVPEVVPVAQPAAPVSQPAASQERRGPLLERLVRFRELLMRHTNAQGVFVLDREGKPVMEDPAFGKLHFLARSLAQAYRPVAGQAGNVHVKIGSNAVLEVVPVETPFGWLVLGAVVPGPLTATAVAEIANALRHAATPR